MAKTNCRPAPSISFSPGLSHDTWSSWRASNPSVYLCPANVAMLPLHQNTCLWDMSLKHWNKDQKILDFFIQQNPKCIIDDQGRLWTFCVHHWVCRFIGDAPESWRYPWKHVGQVSCRGADCQFPKRSIWLQSLDLQFCIDRQLATSPSDILLCPFKPFWLHSGLFFFPLWTRVPRRGCL